MYKVVYKCDSFINYKGVKVTFIIAAVSIPSLNVIVPVDEDGLEIESIEQWESPKYLSIGVAVQREGDVWNEELGKKIAYGKAVKKRDHILATTDPGMINNKMVMAIVEQEASYMQVNPGRYIAGYNDAREKYLKRQAKTQYLNSLTDKQKEALDIVATVSDMDKFLEAVNDRRTMGNNLPTGPVDIPTLQ